MVSIDVIKKELKHRLSPKRFQHSLGVAEEAARLANRYGANPEKAYLAGLIHDCAKEIPAKDVVKLLTERFGVTCDEVALQTPWILHGPLGACVAKQEFGIEDPEILDAVWYHTTGKAGMELFSKIIYIADYIEPNRTYPDVEVLRTLTYEDIDRAILFGIDYTIGELVKRKTVIHPDTMHCRNDILMKMTAKERNGDNL